MSCSKYRILSGGIQLRQEDVDGRGIVRQALETARPLIDEHEHELSVSLSAEPIWLHADPIRLEEVIVNLLNNAAKYTPQGGHIWLNLRHERDEAVLSVRDRGVGVSIQNYCRTSLISSLKRRDRWTVRKPDWVLD